MVKSATTTEGRTARWAVTCLGSSQLLAATVLFLLFTQKGLAIALIFLVCAQSYCLLNIERFAPRTRLWIWGCSLVPIVVVVGVGSWFGKSFAVLIVLAPEIIGALLHIRGLMLSLVAARELA
jgi:hypothetical protein